MQETFDIILPEKFGPPKDFFQVQLMMEALFGPGTSQDKLLYALTEENRDKFGSPKFYDFTFEVKRYDHQSLNGRVRIQYKLQLTFSCSGIVNHLTNQHSYWNFNINPVTYKVHFVGDEYGDLRSTANEF
jgi:hypothetical protein